jgi:hypothetical protein
MKPLTDDMILAHRQKAVAALELMQPLLRTSQALHDSFMEIYRQTNPGWNEDPTKNRQLWHTIMNQQNEVYCQLHDACESMKRLASVEYWENQRQFSQSHVAGVAVALNPAPVSR